MLERDFNQAYDDVFRPSIASQLNPDPGNLSGPVRFQIHLVQGLYKLRVIEFDSLHLPGKTSTRLSIRDPVN